MSDRELPPPRRRAPHPRPGARRRPGPAPARGPRPAPRPPATLRLADGRARLRAAMLVVAIVLTLFLGRLVQLQGLDASAYAAAAEKNRLREVTLIAQRGSITDTHGVPLATSVEAVRVTADQQQIAESSSTPRAIAEAVSPILGIDVDDLTERLTGERRYVVVASAVTPEQWDRVTRSMPLRARDGSVLRDEDGQVRTGRPVGLYGGSTTRRTYPSGDLAGNVLGFLSGDGRPLGGVELALADELDGRDGHTTYERSPDGREIPLGQSVSEDPVPGDDVVLTIDRDVQWVAQDALARKVEETGALSGQAVVMTVDGDILAMATAPTLDPADPGGTPEEARGNSALQDAYEPGSVGKLLTAAAVVEEGAVTPETALTIPNRLARGGDSFKDFEDHGTVGMTYAGTIARSSNIGQILAAERMGFSELLPYFRGFGLGEPVGLGLPEQPGYLPPEETWSATTPYTLTFGQGYSVNAVQMTAAVAGVVGGGTRVHPRLVERVVAPDGTVRENPVREGERVVSEETSDAVVRMMEAVVGEDGTAPATAIAGYRTAGKTGTANRFDEEAGGYSGWTMSYVQVAPADDPQLVVYVALQRPRSGSGGGSTAGPVVKEVMEFALQSQRVPPTGEEPPAVRVYTD
ncbi:peptidoglycan D,D-transpeptidase FtsI family protein [Vallicoccus soli]|uniref:Penicillin-binding protein 2 n=1 Tax=Vallicoccus soli TaxID=2339232 RepID=A0A3A3Z0Q2_9ACTN|nr:penicillin-binding protein 2 [Vallicoccus soli]RJK96825.1 penicillin-binding protein 2 [Vallicoccus soli]